MTLAPGSRLGVYEVTALIGRGGMGAVYRAHDPRLGRDVAIKVLPESIASNPESTARFEREARVLASLNHPHIAAIYGLEETSGPDDSSAKALVLELVDGPTLADRLATGPLSVAEALRLARQVADALEAAHDRGIVHRDLKPANIKVTSDGTAKVLDFGLAKLVAHDSDDSESATVTGTHAGLILGTPRYMSPEQARGHAVDKRTDIWSFGCVLYEMLTGRRTFPGDTLSDSIAATLTLDPDWRLLPEATPASIRTLLQRCLEKDPRQRLRDIGDARIELDAAIGSRDGSASRTEGDQTPGSAGNPPVWRRRQGLIGGAVTLIALTFAAATWLGTREAAPADAVRVTALLPPGVSVTRGPGKLQSLALSPDGRTLVIAGSDAKGQRLYERMLDRLQARALAGTEGGSAPFFSPDGAWIGFFADRRLKRVPAGGGAAVDICATAGYPAGASWGTDYRIVFATGFHSPIWRVQSGGGTPEPLTKPASGHGHSFPEIMPDGRTLLFNERGSIEAVDLASQRRTTLVRGMAPRYLASGHLLLTRGTTLLAVPFDPARLELKGQVVPVLEDVAAERAIGAAHLAVSPAGTLAYVPATSTYALVIVEPDGSERVLSEHVLLQNPQFSPSGKQLVVAAAGRSDESSDLWVHDLEKAIPAFKLTTEGGRAPVWTPDGAAITYSQPGKGGGIYTKPTDGRGVAQLVASVPTFHWLVGWTPQRTLAYGMMESAAADGVSRSSILAIEGGQARRVVGPGDTWGGRLSPDGRWLAYYSLDAGYFEVYVTPFPDTGSRQLIAEGTDPVWSPDGSEIYYRNGSRLMAARLDKASGIRVLSQRLVIEPFMPPLYDDYAIHPNGRTLALVRPAGGAFGNEVTLVLNWLADFRRLVQ